MTPIRAVALMVATFISGIGCSNSTTLMRPDRMPPDQGVTQSRAIANQLAGKEVTVKILPLEGSNLPEGPVLTGKVAALGARHFLLYEAPDKARRIPFEQTRSLSSNSRASGALTGLLVGAATGALTGLYWGSVLSGIGCGDSSGTYCSSSAADTIVPLTMLGAVLFGATGAGIGALIGRRTTLTF